MSSDLRLLNLDEEAELMCRLYGTTGHLVPSVDAIQRGDAEYADKQQYQIDFEYGDVTIQREAVGIWTDYAMSEEQNGREWHVTGIIFNHDPHRNFVPKELAMSGHLPKVGTMVDYKEGVIVNRAKNSLVYSVTKSVGFRSVHGDAVLPMRDVRRHAFVRNVDDAMPAKPVNVPLTDAYFRMMGKFLSTRSDKRYAATRINTREKSALGFEL